MSDRVRTTPEVDLLHPLATLHFERCHIWRKHFKPTRCIVLNDIVCILERGWQGGDLLHIASSTNLHSWRESTLPYRSMSLATYQDQIVAIGGIHSSTHEVTNQLLTSATGTDWTMTLPPMPTSRHATSSISTSSPTTVLVVAGGIGSDGNALNIVEVLIGDHWDTVDPLPKASHDMQSTLHEGNFFFTGGNGNLSIVNKCNIDSLIQSGEQSSDQTLPSPPVWEVLDAPNDSIAIVSYSSRLIVIDMSGCILSYSMGSWVKASREGEEMDEVPSCIAAAVVPGKELVLAHEHGGLYRATVSVSSFDPDCHFISDVLSRLEAVMGIGIVSMLANIYQQLATSSGVTLYPRLDEHGDVIPLPEPQTNPGQYVEEVISQWSAGRSHRPPTWRQLLEVLYDIGLPELSQQIDTFMKGKARYLEAYHYFINNKESLALLFLKLLLLGPPRLGKTTTLRRLMGQIVDMKSAGEIYQEHPSTGVAESSGVLVRSASNTTAVITQSEWSAVESVDDEARMLLHNLVDTLNSLSSAAATSSSSEVQTHSLSAAETGRIAHQLTPAPPATQATRQPQVSVSSRDIPEVMAIFKEAMESMYWKDVKHMFKAYLRVEDTGGQPELMDMLPALTIGPGLYLLFINLQNNLDQRYQLTYCDMSGTSTFPGESVYTVKEMLLSSLASIWCSNASSPTSVLAKDEGIIPGVSNILKTSTSKAYIVGTHKDRVTKDCIKELDKQLQKIVQSTGFSDLVEYSSHDQLIVAVDNMAGGLEEMADVRRLLESSMDRCFEKLRVPVVWLVLNLILRRKKMRTVSLEDCLHLSKSLGMSSYETKVALWFLHHRAGVLMYFPNIPELEDLVITDVQIVYDSVTILILRAMSWEEVGVHKSRKFRKTGIFTIGQLSAQIYKVCGDFIPIEKLVVLLEYLHIIAQISKHGRQSSFEVAYIMPSVLDSATKVELDTISEKPHEVCPIMVRFTCGFVPIGIFPAMIACLINNQSFSVIENGMKKNAVQFHFGVYRTLVTLLCRSMYYEFIVEIIMSEIAVHKECSSLRIEIEASFDRIFSRMNYGALVEYEFAFDCPIHTERGRDHLCVVKKEEIFPVVMYCLQNMEQKRPLKLSDQHKLWYGKALSTEASLTTSIIDESPLYLPIQFEEVVQRCKPKEKISGFNYEEYCKKIEFILYTECDLEFNAALTFMKKPSIEDHTDNVATSLNKNVSIGSFAGGPIALVQGSTGADIIQFINDILETFPEMKYFISVGTGLGFQQKEVKLGDVFISSGFTVVGGYYSTTESDTSLHINILGDHIQTEELLQKLFCADSTVSQPFCVTTGDRIADYHVSNVVSNTFMTEVIGLQNKTIISHPSAIGVDSSRRELFKLQGDKIRGFIVIKSVVGYVNGRKSDIWNVTGALAAVNYVEQKLKPYMDHVTAVDEYESAIKSGDTVDVMVTKLIFLGLPEHGKTTTRQRLTKVITNLSQSNIEEPNKGTSEQSMVIACKDVLCDTVLAKDKSEWISIDESEVLQFCINAQQETEKPIRRSKRAVTKPVIHQESHGSAKEPSIPPQSKRAVTKPVIHQQSHGSAKKTSIPKSKHAVTKPVIHQKSRRSTKGPSKLKSEVSCERESVCPTSSEISALNVEWGRRVFNDLKSKKYYIGTWKKRLDKGCLLYMHDTGGLLELMGCLPFLTIGPALYLLFCKLTSTLDEKCEIGYNGPNMKSQCIQSSFTVKETILSALASIASMNYSSADQNPEKNCVYLIGTHYDEVKDKPETIFQFESKLEETMQSTSFYKEDLVRLWHEKELPKNKALGMVNRHLYLLDNKFGDDKEMEYLRSSIHKGLDQLCGYKKIPTTWLVFGMLLQARKESFISLRSCYELGANFGMTTKTTKSVLHFLHYDIGICMYFSNIPSLKNIVIPNTQAVYKSLMVLIEAAFEPSQECVKAANMFKETGHFSIKDFQVALQSASLLPLKILVHILKQLNIIAPVPKEDMFFMPCILRNASNDEIAKFEFEESQVMVQPSLTPLFITYECGFVPLGVFSSMLVNFKQISSQKAYEDVVLKSDTMRRNHVQFMYGLDKITFIHTPAYVKIIVAQRSEKKTHELCNEVRMLVKNTLELVTASMLVTKPRLLQSFQFAFMCYEHLEQEHLCVVTGQVMSDMWMTCLGDGNNTPLELKEEHLIWYGKPLSNTSRNSSLSPTSSPTLSKLHLLKWTSEDGQEHRLRIINEVSSQWKMMGDLMGMRLSVMDRIERESLIVTDCCRRVFHEWLMQEGYSSYPVTWLGLYELLMDLDFPAIADQLKQFFK